MSKQITMKVVPESFKRIEDPIKRKNMKKYIFNVLIDDVATGIPMATNPREQKINSNVATAIRESLESNDGLFYLKNRGIVLSAGNVRFDNKKNEVTIFFDDMYDHGNIDGGHTYKIVQEKIGEGLDQWVQFEVMTGVEGFIVSLAEARNTSVQVDAKSLAELNNKFEPIKEGIEGLPFYSRIAFKQNQIESDDITGKNLKMIDARELVAIISMFDKEKFTGNVHPMQAYSSKEAMLKNYLQDSEYFRKFTNVMGEIFDIFDDVEKEFPEAFNSTGGRYGRKKYSGYKEDRNGKQVHVSKSKFGNEDLYYKVPDGIIYPIVASFRALLELDNEKNKYFFKKCPRGVWSSCRENVAKNVMNFSKSIGDNPNALGKDENIWQLLYMIIELESMK